MEQVIPVLYLIIILVCVSLPPVRERDQGRGWLRFVFLGLAAIWPYEAGIEARTEIVHEVTHQHSITDTCYITGSSSLNHFNSRVSGGHADWRLLIAPYPTELRPKQATVFMNSHLWPGVGRDSRSCIFRSEFLQQAQLWSWVPASRTFSPI